MDPDTFSSEIGDVHDRGGRRDSFSNEFRGAPDYVIEDQRPEQPMVVGRRGRRALWIFVLVGGLLLGGGSAFWYWSEPIGEWIAGLGRDDQEQGDDDDAEQAEAEVEAEPKADLGPQKVFGIRGDPGEPLPTAPEGQAEGGAGEGGASPASPTNPTPTTPPTPTPTPSTSTKVETLTTQVGGKISSGGVASRLAKVDTALAECWAKAPAAKPVELELRFRIKWNGKAFAITVRGGDDALQRCVRQALPGSGWPHPRDGGEGRVARKWKLGG